MTTNIRYQVNAMDVMSVHDDFDQAVAELHRKVSTMWNGREGWYGDIYTWAGDRILSTGPDARRAVANIDAHGAVTIKTWSPDTAAAANDAAWDALANIHRTSL